MNGPDCVIITRNISIGISFKPRLYEVHVMKVLSNEKPNPNYNLHHTGNNKENIHR